jgi:hypothetical protein
MRVLEHQPNAWFLIEDECGFILDVNCNHSYFSYSFSMILNQGEQDRYVEDGVDYLDRLADSINCSAPIAAASNSIYKARKLDDSYSDKITAAITEWRESLQG